MKKLLVLASVLLLSITSAYAQFTLMSIDCPGVTETTARGINNHGDIVGAYALADYYRHPVLIKGGKCIPLAADSILATYYSEAFKINDSGDVAGFFYDDNFFVHGFLLKKGVLTIIDYPTANDTYVFGINESGTVVGGWDILDAQQNLIAEYGFTWHKGNFAQVNVPGAGDTVVKGNNAPGDLVGGWDSGPTATALHGFVFSKGQVSSFDVPYPGAWATHGNAINAKGNIVGLYLSDYTGLPHAFLKAGTTFTQIAYPGAIGTSAWGINSAGQMVGIWYDTDGNAHGWLGQPGNKGKPAAGLHVSMHTRPPAELEHRLPVTLK